MRSDEQLILGLLLDRFERSRHYQAPGDSPRSVTVKYDADSLPDYWDERHGERRVELNQATRRLEADGLVTVQLGRYSREEIDRVDLALDRVADAYARAGRIPKRTQEERLAAVAAGWASRWLEDDWRRAFAKAVAGAVSGFARPPLGLRPEEDGLLEDLCRVLDALGPAGLPAETPRRVFSTRALGSSKRLEAIQSRVVRLLREYWPAPLPAEDRDVLAELGVVENPQHVFVAGPVVLDGVDASATGAGIGLPAAFVDRCEVTKLGAACAITVENLTSYYQVVASLPRATVAVYLGGYHNRARRQLMLKLAGAGCREFHHWGDIDLGGFRIYAHLQQRTGLPLAPLLMDVETYRRHRAEGLPFGDAYAAELAGLLEQEAYEPFWPVVREMLESRRRVEQEGVAFIWSG